MEFTKVRLDIEGSVGIITMNDPATMNAMGLEMLQGMNEALEYIEQEDNGIRAVVLTGEGRGFCSGANLNPGSGGGAATAAAGGGGNARPDAGAALETGYHPVLRRMRELNVPIVSAVNGAAAGVGMSFALMGDMVIAEEKSYFLQAFRRIGLVPDGGSTWILPRLIGTKRAMELSLLGEKLPAPTALEWGLINRVVADGTALDAAKALAAELADGPTTTLSMIRDLYWSSFENSYEEQIHQERKAQRIAGRTADFIEGVTAFLQKRKANFTGK